MRKPEDIIENHLIVQCKKRRFMCLKFRSPGYNGVPDRLVLGNGQVVFIELKRPGKDLDPLQVVVGERMRRRGADVRMADTKERVNEILHEISAGSLSAAPATPDITHLLRTGLEKALPGATPEQINELTATAAALGKSLRESA